MGGLSRPTGAAGICDRHVACEGSETIIQMLLNSLGCESGRRRDTMPESIKRLRTLNPKMRMSQRSE